MSDLRARLEGLTGREREVMGLVTAGLMNKQIAGELGLSEITVKIHRGHVMRKMAARSLADLVGMGELLGGAGTKPERKQAKATAQPSRVHFHQRSATRRAAVSNRKLEFHSQQKRVNHRKVQQAPHAAITRLARDAADRAGNMQRNPSSTETRPAPRGRSP